MQRRDDFPGHHRWLSDFDDRQRRIDRANRRIVILACVILLGIGAALVWSLTHPEAIGSFFGRIAAGFAGAAR